MDDTYALDETMNDMVDLSNSSTKVVPVVKPDSLLKRKLNAISRLVEKLTEDGIEAIRKRWREMDTGSGGKDYEAAQSYIRGFIDRKFSDIEIRQLLHIGSSRIQRLRQGEAEPTRMLPHAAVVRVVPADVIVAIDNTVAGNELTHQLEIRKDCAVKKRKRNAIGRLVEKLTEDGIETIRKQWREMDTGSGGKDYEAAQSYIRGFINQKFSDIEIRQLLHVGSSRIQRLRSTDNEEMRQRSRQTTVINEAVVPSNGKSDSPELLMDIDSHEELLHGENSYTLTMS